MKFIKRLIWFLVFVAIIAATGSFVIVFKYEGDIKNFVVVQINKQLATEIDVKEVQLSVFKKFPYTSLEFQNVLAKDALITIGEKDTFFYFQHAYLQFNLIDILKNKYVLREITLEDGFINPRVDKKGYDNYHIFKKTESNTNDFLINLEKVTLNNVEVDYIEEQRKDRVAFDAHHAYLKGAFSKDEFELDVFGEFDLYTCTFTERVYAENRALELDAGLYINSGTKHYEIRRGGIEVDNQQNFSISGIIENAEEVNLDLKIEGKNLNLVKALALLPQNYTSRFSQYKSSGTVTFTSTIKGEVSKNRSPTVFASFSVSNGSITEPSQGIELTSVNLNGKYSSDLFELTNVSANLEGGSISGNFKLEGTKQPLLTTNVVAELDLEKTKKFLQLDTLKFVKGSFFIDANYKGKIQDISNLRASDMKRAKTEGNVKLKNVSFQVNGSDKVFESVNADLSLHGNDVLIDQLEAKTGSSDFSLSGIFTNMMSFLLVEDQNLTVEAEFISHKLDFNELLTAESSSSDTTYSIKLPQNINLNLKASIGEVEFRRFEASEITGIVIYSSNKLKISPLRFQSMDGSFDGNCLVYPSGNNYKLITNASIKGVDVNQLFYDFEDFGQSELNSNHLKGKADASVTFRAEMNDQLEFDKKKIYTNVDIKINDGELIGFEPLYAVSDYIKSNKLLNIFIKADAFRKELEHIRFSTLRNQILIKDETIFIPQMEINSSAMNLVAEGTHTFDNHIDYKMNFYLSELLTKGKERQNKDGKTQVYLTMKGTANDPTVEYEKLTSNAKVVEEVKAEKKEVKQALKDEFGLFENDTTLSNEVKDEKIEFSIEWDETESENTQTNKSKEDNQTTKQKFIEVIRNNEKEKKNTDDFDFDDGDF